jgi:hypothetical protein
MASLDSLSVRNLLKTGVSVYSATDKQVALRLRAKAAAGAVTSITTVTATGVTIVTAGGGTDAYLFSAYATMGALADAINADGMFECRVLDVLRSAASDDALLAEALTTPTYDENGNAVYDIKVDTSGMFGVGACLSSARGFDSPYAGHRVHLAEIAYVANMGTAANDQLVITARDIASGVERVLWKGATVDTTATTVTFASGTGYISSRDGEEIIVSIKDAASMADGAYMRLSGIVE